MMDDQARPAPGDRIVVRTPDRRTYYGRLLELRERAGAMEGVVRLDTGWVTAYPVHMLEAVHVEVPGQNGPAV